MSLFLILTFLAKKGKIILINNFHRLSSALFDSINFQLWLAKIL